MTVRAEIASGASGTQYRPAVVATVLCGAAGLTMLMVVGMIVTGAPIVALVVMATVPIGLCLYAGFWLISTPYAVRWNEKALELAFAFRRDIVNWREVESYWKFSVRWGGGAHVEEEMARIGVFLKYRSQSQGRERVRWAIVGVPGFVAAESFGLFGPPMRPGRYTTPFDVYVRDQASV